ncbi:MAG: alpha/beta hydrolase [Ahrensia sp.]|nr:alpha/beta hydrolase [Ahrensia sp.]
MKVLLITLVLVVAIFVALFIWTRLQVAQIEQAHPPQGQFVELSNGRLHFVDLQARGDLPPILFIHGASGNLNDQRVAYENALSGTGRLIFIDRPGHGYSDRAGADDPAKQADIYAQFLSEIGVESAIIVCHSLGCASAAAMAVNHPDRVQGLVFVAPATHEWPGGVTWYYDIASLPIIGWLFTETLTLPFGRVGLDSGVASVFKPNKPVPDYASDSAVKLVLRPQTFRHNAHDVATLKAFVTRFQPRYESIAAPTEIITGDSDDVVLPEIHSVGLERDIAGAQMTVLPGVGHKPDYIATDVVVGAIRRVAAQSIAQSVER